MQLIEIKGLIEIETGATAPIILTSNYSTTVTFYAQTNINSDDLIERNTVYDNGVYSLIFNPCLYYKFGMPNNETIGGHPYYELGLASYAFYELKDSDLIKQLETIGRAHPYHNSDKWKEYRHYILTFHDNMFECVAKEFEIREENISVYQQASNLLNELSADDF